MKVAIRPQRPLERGRRLFLGDRSSILQFIYTTHETMRTKWGYGTPVTLKLLYRVQQARSPAKRAAKIAEMVAMLTRGDTLHPRKAKRSC